MRRPKPSSPRGSAHAVAAVAALGSFGALEYPARLALEEVPFVGGVDGKWRRSNKYELEGGQSQCDDEGPHGSFDDGMVG